MLVLSRKVGERLVIADNIVVEVVRIRGNRITLGVVAPEDVKVMRSELKVHQQSTKSESQPASQHLAKAC